MKKKQAWHKTKHPGVRFRIHPTRKHGIQPDKYFCIVYRLNGKVKSEAIGWASEKWSAEKAAAELSELRRNQRRGQGPQTMAEKRELEQQRRKTERIQAEIEKKQNITFGDFFEQTYWPIAQSSKKLESYRKEKEHFENWIKPVVGDLTFREIGQIQTEKIKRDMQRARRAPRSVEYVLSTFRQVWKMAQKSVLTERECPTSDVKINMPDNNRSRYLTHEESEKLLEALKKKSLQVYRFAVLSLDTGCRFSEAANLRWKDIDTDRGVINYRDAKKAGSTKSRTVPMTTRVKDLFELMTPGEKQEIIFPDKKGNVQRKISHSFYRCVNDLKLNEDVTDPREKIVFHSLRHSYASRLVMAGVGLYLVQKLLGHSNSSVTERYSHLSNDSLAEAVLQMEQIESFKVNNNSKTKKLMGY